ncbi:MAG: DUF6436 domain-containing protein [Pseudomonadales bacterium]|jgi:hypothetical protein|nr:DUF6436 domain-containing protein [Pseudomonadales bacterium]
MRHGRSLSAWLHDPRTARWVAGVWLVTAATLLWQVGPGARASWSADPADPWAAFVFERDAVAAAVGALPGFVPDGRTTVLHLGAADCRCTRRTAPHRARIEAAFAARNVRFVTVSEHDPAGAALWRAMPATPAAVIIDADGTVRYAGPYSNDGSCLQDGGEGPVEETLDALLSGTPRGPTSPLGVGCLCATDGGTTTL